MTASALADRLLALPLRAGHDDPRRYRLLWLALALSLAIHLAFTLWPVDPPAAPDDIPLTATITELPPPPTAVATPAPAKKARRTSPLVPPAPMATAEPLPEVPEATASPPAPAPQAAPAPALAEDVAALPSGPVATSATKSLPPRVDLAYKVFFGTQGFHVGDATYRFEHSDNRYRIHTVGQAKGLAALLLRGQGRLESRGLITAGGLQPYEFSFERSDNGRRESALFYWESGIVALNDQKSAPLELPTFDVLSLMWQYYFTPPDAVRVAFGLATTRRMLHFTITREGTETLRWGGGDIETERWHRRSDDGKTDALVWLAPSLRYLPVKMRVVNTDRGTAEVLLDSIRVDVAGGVAGADTWAPNITGAGATKSEAAAAAPAPPAASFAPAATFPTGTGQ
jgi:hypothetical protein